MLDNIDQIVGELHFGDIYGEEWGMLDIFRTLMTKFVNVNLHMNNYACLNSPFRNLKSSAVEFSLVNRKLITLNSQSRSYAMHPLNKPNRAAYDCQMQELPPSYTQINVPTVAGFHEPNQNHKHEGITFLYPTLGIPVPGNTYNNTKVAPNDLAAFDDQVNALFKPYNVHFS